MEPSGEAQLAVKMWLEMSSRRQPVEVGQQVFLGDRAVALYAQWCTVVAADGVQLQGLVCDVRRQCSRQVLLVNKGEESGSS